MGESRIRKGK